MKRWMWSFVWPIILVIRSFVITHQLFDIGKTALRAVFLLSLKSSFLPMRTGLKHGMM
jgi:hypothetical protein